MFLLIKFMCVLKRKDSTLICFDEQLTVGKGLIVGVK
jgi:hypothetical protein